VKLDAIICTKDPANIKPELLDTLRTAKWCSQIIVETSAPLSTARVVAARKAVEPVLLYADDDIGDVKDVPEKLAPYLKDPKVVAVSTQVYDQNPHWIAYRKALYDLYPNHHEREGNFDNRLFLIRREFMARLNPPQCFYCEDAWLHHHVRQLGLRWVHLPYMGVRHYPHYRSWAPWGYWAQKLGIVERSPIISFPGRLLVSYIAFLHTLDPRTLKFGVGFAVQWFSGWMMAKVDGY
jgi:hypothetical protein